MVIRKKIIRNMMEHKITYGISILLLILSCMLFTMFNLTVTCVKSEVQQYKEECNVEDIFFQTNLKIQNLDMLESEYDLQIEKEEWKDIETDNGINIRVYKKREKINKHKIYSGKDLKQDGEIIINPEFYENNSIDFGQKIKLDDKRYTVVGTAVSPDYIYMLENDMSLFCNKETFAVAFVSENDFDDIDKSSQGYSVVFNKDNAKSFKQYIKDNYGLLSWVEKGDNSKIKAIDGFIDSFSILGVYVPIGIMIITSLIISIVLWKLIKNEVSQLGTLYAMGYAKSQIIKHYMSYPLIIAFIGTIFGQIPGYLSTEILKSTFKIEYTLPKINIAIDYKIILISILLPSLIILSINFVVIMKALNHNIVDLMKGKLKEEKPNFIERRLSLNKIKFRTRFKLKDLVKNLGRSILTIFAIIFSSFLLFMVFTVNGSMSSVIKDGYEDTIAYKKLWMLSNIGTKDLEGEVFWNILATTNDESGKEVVFTIESRDKNSRLVNLYDFENNRISFNNVIITTSLANKLNVKEGDLIKVKSKLDDTIFYVKIDKVTQYYLTEKLYIPLEKLYNYTDIPDDSYIGVQSIKEIEFDEDDVSSSMTKDGMIDGVNNMLLPLKGIMYIIGIFSLIIAIAVIYIIVNMLINENRINISMFKIIGYDNKSLNKIILNENDGLVVAGFILSVPISKYLLDILFKEVTKTMNFTMMVDMSKQSILIVFILVILVYEFTKRIAERNILKVEMSEVLKKGRE